MTLFSALLMISAVQHWSAQDAGEQVWTTSEVDKAREGIEYQGEPTVPKADTPLDVSPEPEANALEKKSEFLEMLKNFFKSPGGKIITFLVILSLLVFTLFKFIKKDTKVINSKIITLDEQALQQLEENLVETDLEKYLRLALDAGDHKLAIRILYLSILQNLHELKFIEWKKGKTNNDYMREMRTHKSYHVMRELTLAFEIVWYGDTEISEADYKLVFPAFNQFQQDISGKEKVG